MPITQSAKKALRQSQKRRLINLNRKRRLKEIVKGAISQPDKNSLATAYKIIDTARKHHIIHPNKARHLKSKIARTIRKPIAKSKHIVDS